MDHNVYSGAIGIIRSGSWNRLHKTSCKDIKLSLVYSNNVYNTLPIYWHCKIQRTGKPRVTTRIKGIDIRMLHLQYFFRPLTFTECWIAWMKRHRPLIKRLRFTKIFTGLKFMLLCFCSNFLFLCFYFHQYQALFSLPYR